MWRADLKLLRTFRAIASKGSLTSAATALNLTQPAVSGHLKELEEQLGFKLFERSTRRVDMTQQALEILSRVEALMAQADDLELWVKQVQISRRSHFLLGAVMYTLDFPERNLLLDAFERGSPGDHFSIENYLQVEQIPRLLKGTLDASLLLGVAIPEDVYTAAIRGWDKYSVGNELLFPDTLERIVLGSRKIKLLVPVESELARFEVIPQEALRGTTLAMIGSGHGFALIEPIEAFFQKCSAVLHVPSDTNSVAVHRHAWLNRIPSLDLGWHNPPSGPPGEMERRSVEGLDQSTDFVLALGSNPSPSARKFFDFAAKYVGRPLN